MSSRHVSPKSQQLANFPNTAGPQVFGQQGPGRGTKHVTRQIASPVRHAAIPIPRQIAFQGQGASGQVTLTTVTQVVAPARQPSQHPWQEASGKLSSVMPETGPAYSGRLRAGAEACLHASGACWTAFTKSFHSCSRFGSAEIGGKGEPSANVCGPGLLENGFSSLPSSVPAKVSPSVLVSARVRKPENASPKWIVDVRRFVFTSTAASIVRKVCPRRVMTAEADRLSPAGGLVGQVSTSASRPQLTVWVALGP